MTEYFTAAFPTLFLYRRGGHMPASDERSIPVSLEAWANWSLGHHSRRFMASRWMYPIYYLLTIKQICSPSNFYVFIIWCDLTSTGRAWQLPPKRGDYEAVQGVISSLTHKQLAAAAQSLHVSQTTSDPATSDPAIATLRRSIQAIRVPNSLAQKTEYWYYCPTLPALVCNLLLSWLRAPGRKTWLIYNVGYIMFRKNIDGSNASIYTEESGILDLKCSSRKEKKNFLTNMLEDAEETDARKICL